MTNNEDLMNKKGNGGHLTEAFSRQLGAQCTAAAGTLIADHGDHLAFVRV